MGYLNPLHPTRGVSLKVLDACWCPPGRRKSHVPDCRRERDRMGLKNLPPKRSAWCWCPRGGDRSEHTSRCRRMTKIKRPLSLDTASFHYGIRIAAEVAAAYDHMSSHPHLVSDCILGKLNLLDRAIRRNKYAQRVHKALDALERKVASIEGMSRFMAHDVLRARTPKKGTARPRTI